MRNKYTKEFENDMIVLAPFYTLNELLEMAKKQYNAITKRQLQLYLSKRKIRYKDYMPNKARDMGKYKPLFSERIKPDGMVQVKIAKNKWDYKQRYIYSKYYNEELTENDYIIFLDQDRANFNIDNLKKVTRRESSILSNRQIFSSNPLATKTGIEIAKLIIKTKEKEKTNETTNK